MPYKILERKGMVKKTIYHTCELLASVFSVVEKILELYNITGTSCTQHQAINIAYIIINRTGNLSLEIHECNRMATMKNNWVSFKHFLRTAYHELRETTDITVQDAGMHHVNMVRGVVTGLQEALKQESAPVEAPVVMEKH